MAAKILANAAATAVDASVDRVHGREFVTVPAMRALLRLTAQFHRHIGQIVVMGAKKQMIGTNARRIVAAMADAQAVWDASMGHFIRQAVSVTVSAVDCPNLAITESAFRRGPIPAIARAINLSPKTPFDGHRRSLT